jgi:phosphoglycolate phosphatase
VANGISLLWDIDGTLLKTNGLGKIPLTRAILEVTGTKADYDLRTMSGLTDYQIVDHILNDNFFETQDRVQSIDKILELYCDYYEDLMPNSQINQLNNIDLILQQLSKNPDISNWICTGNIFRGAVLKLRATNLESYFSQDNYFCPESLEPRSNIVSRAVAKGANMDLKPIVIGDTLHDIEASHKVGVECVALESEGYPFRLLVEGKPKTILRLGWKIEDLLSAIYE